MYEFRSCPFCGSTNIVLEKSRKVDWPDQFPLMANVECLGCGAQTRPIIIDGSYGETTTEADAVNAWNRSADL